MKKTLFGFLVLLLCASCADISTEFHQAPQLTLYAGSATETPTPDEAQEVTAELAEATVVPTPIVHVVALGETVSSIAFAYGVTIDAILAANPTLSPRVMIVGDEVIIPANSDVLPGGSTILDSDAVEAGEPNCQFTSGGLWCGVWLTNKTDDDLRYPVVLFDFLDEDGNLGEEKKVPAVMRELPAGAKVPAVVFLEAIPNNYRSVTASPFSVESVTSKEIELEIEVVEQNVNIQSATATVYGTMKISSFGTGDRANLNIAAAALDAEGRLLGLRREEAEVALNQLFNFSLTIYSAGGNIAEVIFFAEAF